MARAALKHLLVLCALALALAPGASGCSEGREGAGGQAGAALAPAGSVVELDGSVTAVRADSSPRPLRRGDTVFPDDTVATAAGASVTILLGHNQARWSLSGGQSRRVDRSAAWRAEASGAGSSFDDDGALPTASAGRHSEQQVGDTRATAAAPKAPPEARVADAEAAPARAPRRKKPRAVAEAPTERAKGPVKEPAGFGLALGAVPQAPAGGRALGISGSAAAGLGAVSVKGSRQRGEVSDRLAAELGRAVPLCSMSVSKAGAVSLRFAIRADGSVARVRVTGPSALVGEVGDCLRKQVEEIRFEGRAKGSTRVRQSVRFEVR